MLWGIDFGDSSTAPSSPETIEGTAVIKERLSRLGLTSNQAAIFVLLVTHGELRIQEIANLARMPRSSVYEALRKLYELGIAEEITEEHYKKVRPYPLSVMRTRMDERINDLQALSSELDTLEETLAANAAQANSALSTVKYYKDRSGAQQLFWNSLKARDTVYVYSEWSRGRYVGWKYYERFVEESRRRKITEKVLINPTDHALELIRKYNHPGSTMARTRIEDIRVIEKSVMNIKGETLIYDGIYAQCYLRTLKINGFEIENSAFAASQRSLFEFLWSKAEPVQRYL